MKLSEAIRLGSMLKPQLTNALFISGGKSCALGAALDAIGQKVRDFDGFGAVEAAFPICLIRIKHPNEPRTYDLDEVIADLNDNHGWTREQIADWVEAIEHAQEQPTEPVDVGVAVRA
jgi:hypothetical protein